MDIISGTKLARVGDVITPEEIDKWNKGDYILIEAQTGRGKTFFVRTRLHTKALFNPFVPLPVQSSSIGVYQACIELIR